MKKTKYGKGSGNTEAPDRNKPISKLFMLILSFMLVVCSITPVPVTYAAGTQEINILGDGVETGENETLGFIGTDTVFLTLRGKSLEEGFSYGLTFTDEDNEPVAAEALNEELTVEDGTVTGVIQDEKAAFLINTEDLENVETLIITGDGQELIKTGIYDPEHEEDVYSDPEEQDVQEDNENKEADPADESTETPGAEPDGDTAEEPPVLGTSLTYEGEDYTVTVSSEEPAFTESMTLKVEEIKEEDNGYGSYYDRTLEVMQEDHDDVGYLRLFDISVMDGDEKIQPSSEVTVKIEYHESPEINCDAVSVVHFKETEDEEEPELIGDVQVDETSTEISFSTDGFSVYAIVETIEMPTLKDLDIRTIDEIDQEQLYIFGRLNNTYYATDEFVTASGLEQIKRAKNNKSLAVLYTFTKVEGTDNVFTIQNSETGQYLNMSAAGSMSFSDTDPTEYTIEYFNDGVEGVFYIYRIGNGGNKYCLNLKGGENGKGIAGSTYKDNGSKMYLQRPPQAYPTDPLRINGETYGLILYKPATNVTGSTAAAAMPSAANGVLTSRAATIMMDPTGRTDHLFVTKDTDIGMWTFHAQTEDKYYITTEIDGRLKYLRMSGAAVSLVDEPDEKCLLTMESAPANSVLKGRVRIKSGNYALTLKNGNLNAGFYGKIPADDNDINTWLNFAEVSSIAETDFISYSAKKVSVSSPSITTGSQVIVYTRVWNSSEKRYDFFAIDHDGGLIQCYEYGDTVWWKEGRINTLLWDFTEYFYEGTTDPNYYYDLQNVYSGKYLAPQLNNGALFSDSPIGITLNGRRYGDYYSKILAWDDPYYDYAGIAVEGAQLKTSPMSKASEFYFAIPEEDISSHLTTTDTVNNTEHGISMKMTLYDRSRIVGNRNKYQTDVLGNDEEKWLPLVSSELGSDGYPTALLNGNSLAPLFSNGTDANHIFIKNTYDEGGYFEYDCTKNFAHFNEGTGDFTVYNQLGSFDTMGKSSQHGQFMPYDDLTEGEYSDINFNRTDVLNGALPDSNPRKDERMFNITRADAHYFFGMELDAAFMQNESGEDQFGHDLVFEFSGDDDMWLYIDGKLVLDLGGVHSAFRGTVNFKTGVVTMNRQEYGRVNTTLRDIFRDIYLEEHPSATDQETEDYLNGIFDGNTFRDYSAHSMKMLYMERGAGSSNLHMKFNLTTIEEGQVFVNKKVTGTDKQDYMSLIFPYQVEVYDDLTDTWNVLEQGWNGDRRIIEYYGSSEPIEMAPDNKTFYLKAGETAVLNLPSDDTVYRVTELDVNTNIYDVVAENGDQVTGVQVGTDRYNFTTDDARVGDRKKVVYNNHVDPNALRNLTLTKRLFDADGQPLTKSDDPTTFRFRMYLGEDENGNPEYYRMGSYHVKDPDGYYCRYSYADGGFVSTNVMDLDTLTEDERARFTFTTSPSGAIDKIPADYSVELRGLMVGMRFQAEEKESDMPKGYKLTGYERIAGSYIINPGDPVNRGTVRDNADPAMEVKNTKGWGITAEKEWTDESFMQSHGTIYMGIYNGNALVPGTLREYTSQTRSLYWYLDHLNGQFSDYAVYEVTVTNPVVDTDGYVTSYSSIERCDAGDSVLVSGITSSGAQKNDLEYNVEYDIGPVSGTGTNLRTDTVENIASGICLIKTDMEGNPVTGGTFTLKDSLGQDVSAPSYTARRRGIITTAHLDDGEYTLEESESPWGYQKLMDSVTFTVTGGRITSISDNINCSVVQHGGLTELRIKNKKADLRFIKMNEDLTEPLEGATFALYRELATSTGNMKDYRPMEGYEHLVSGPDGVIQGLSLDLLPGTYYLEETTAAEGYLSLGDVKFTIHPDSTVTLDDGPAELATSDGGTVYSYIIRVKNREHNKVQLLKVDEYTGSPLSGAAFELYTSLDFSTLSNRPIEGRTPVARGTTLSDGLIDMGKLPNGTYYLLETETPNGYITPDAAIKVVVKTGGITAGNCAVVKVGDTYQITVTNTPDSEYVLPAPTGIARVPKACWPLMGAALIMIAICTDRRRKTMDK